MKVLYFTNENITDWNIIPDIIKATGDEVMVQTSRVSLKLILENEIDFIVSDRSRFLIKKDVIDYLPRKIVNLHPSYLPWNRGYHPNYWSIKEKTPFGVTLHFIDEGIDTGDIIAQSRISYSDTDTLRETYNRLRRLMVYLFQACWAEVRNCKIKGVTQDRSKGSIHYKKDFEGVYETFPHGWDTEVSLIR